MVTGLCSKQRHIFHYSHAIVKCLVYITDNNYKINISFDNKYRITAVLKVETDIIISMTVESDRTICDTSVNVYRDLQS